jgi:hypothetical protein
MSRSVIPIILALLECYLANKSVEWRALPSGGPTLPHKREGRVLSVHVGKLVDELGVNPEWRQHFKNKSVRTIVNQACREQGLVGVGESIPLQQPNQPAARAPDRSGNRVLLVEAEATILAQAQRIGELEGRLRLMQSTGVLVQLPRLGKA